jgi:ankyrin repeat protein
MYHKSACYSGFLNIVNILLENGVDPNIPDYYGKTPLMWGN